MIGVVVVTTVDRRGQRHAGDKEPLVQRDPEQRCEKEQGQVMRGDMFAAGKQRQDPERCRGADHPQSGERQRTDQTALQYGFRHGRHDTPEQVGPEHGQMAGIHPFRLHRRSV